MPHDYNNIYIYIYTYIHIYTAIFDIKVEVNLKISHHKGKKTHFFNIYKT